MQENYLGFLDFRATHRRLIARFSRPRELLLHILIFVTSMTAVWAYGIVWRLWYASDHFVWPMTVGVIWSLALAVHAVLHYRRSAAVQEQREQAVEDEMRQFIDRHGDEVDQPALFEMHQQFEAELEQQGRWSLALTAFAMVNAVSWAAAALDMGTSWAFQMTLPLAVLIIGGVKVFLHWQYQRVTGYVGWFARLPLRHMVAYVAGNVGLWMAAAYRMINPWDADTLFKGWSVVLLLHIIWNAAAWPLLQPFVSAQLPAKRKLSNRLELADDGELPDVQDDPKEAIRHRR